MKSYILALLFFPFLLQTQNLKLKGTNLGNWLVPEGYIFKFKDTSSPRMISQIITGLIGLDKLAIMNSIPIPFPYKMFTAEKIISDLIMRTEVSDCSIK